MDESQLHALKDRRPQIRERWEALLRIERLHTPLADPDILVYLFDQTLDEVLSSLPGHVVGPVKPLPKCRSEVNPMKVYFPALEQALMEALVLVQTEMPELNRKARVEAVEELATTLHQIAQREITLYDKIFQSNPQCK